MEENMSEQTKIPTRQNIEQKRGAQAWRYIQQEVKGKGETLEKEYRSLARGLNAMIQINGLGQTLGFLKAKGKGDSGKAHFLLLTHLTDWMRGPNHFSATNMAVMNDGQYGFLK